MPPRSPVVLRMLTLTGMNRMIKICPDVASALNTAREDIEQNLPQPRRRIIAGESAGNNQSRKPCH